MSDERARIQTGPLTLRVQSGKLLNPADIAERVENFEVTEEGTLRSIRGPTPFLPETTGFAYPSYGRMYGVFHALLQNGQRDITLVHTGEELWVFSGYKQVWEVLLTQGLGFSDDNRARFPTQFEATPTGIVIVPQGRGSSRAYFYDGEVILPLGYSQTPGTPSGLGPETPAGEENSRNANTEGYSIRRYTMNRTEDTESQHGHFGTGRIGTVMPAPGAVFQGWVMSGYWRAAVQWIDRWGNLSPISGRSGAISIDQRSSKPDSISSSVGAALETAHLSYPIETVQHQFLWTSIDRGPEGTIGRKLLRTKDLDNSGTVELFEVPGNAAGGTMAFSTIPDNVSEIWTDNAPDGWLLTTPVDVLPVPDFKLCCVAMGRLWIANTTGDPGILIPSLPGRWGTFERDSEMFPDASGAEITGLCRVGGGLLVFTETSTFFVTPSDDGRFFKASTISDAIGCVAPSSIATLRSAGVVWLGRDGFYLFDGQGVRLLSTDVKRQVRQINWSRALQSVAAFDDVRGEYRCWVPYEASDVNNRCFIFDGRGWRTRLDETFNAVCVTRDHRQLMLAAGKNIDSGGNSLDGVWILDQENQTYIPATRSYEIETGWIGASSPMRKSVFTVKLWLRETDVEGTLTVDVFRDWRKKSSPDHSVVFNLDSPEDQPPSYGNTNLGTDGADWVRRRPYWIRKDIAISSCEVYKLLIRTYREVEFLAIMIDEGPRLGSVRIPRSS